jgi:hypothetical protein
MPEGPRPSPEPHNRETSPLDRLQAVSERVKSRRKPDRAFSTCTTKAPGPSRTAVRPTEAWLGTFMSTVLSLSGTPQRKREKEGCSYKPLTRENAAGGRETPQIESGSLLLGSGREYRWSATVRPSHPGGQSLACERQGPRQGRDLAPWRGRIALSSSALISLSQMAISAV